ncbi:MAG: glycosyltransferase [Candidatus Melainabacteria bacterium]|nr:glycosyltransferase [Candidatus Melainabacteria bacterium]
MSNAPKILAIIPSLIASCQINVLKPLNRLAEQGKVEFRWAQETKADVSDVTWSDVVIFCRNTEPAYGHLLNAAVCAGKPIIFDLDDNFWDIPYDTDPELARYHRLPPRLAQLEKYLSFSSLVRVYSPVLADRVGAFSKKIKLLKSGFDFSLVSGKVPKKSGNISIVYATSRIVDDQYHEFLTGIIRVLDAYQDKVTLTICGCKPRELAARRGVNLIPLLPDYDKFLMDFHAQGFDVGLAPLPNTVFHRSKNNTKFRDYGACRVAGVYSNVDVYSSCIEDGRTGILVDNTPESWFQGIVKLIDDPSLIASIKEQAYTYVYEQYRQELVEDEWMVDIASVLSPNLRTAKSGTAVEARDIRVRADFLGLYGIRIPGESPDGERVGRLMLEVLTPEGYSLREASSSVLQYRDDGDIEIKFDPIANSRRREFVFRLISLPDESGAATGWLPPSGHMQMLYKSGELVGSGADA